MPTTDELLVAAKTGDRNAVDGLVDEFRPQLLAFCLRRMGFELRKVVKASDILQETSLKAFQSIGNVQWQGERALCSWFCGIAQNAIYSHPKRLLRIRHSDVELDTPDIYGASPSRYARREARFDRLEQALCKLTEEQQHVIRLTHIEGLSVREAALCLDRTE